MGLAPVPPAPPGARACPWSRSSCPRLRHKPARQGARARSLALGPKGTLIVGTRGDKVFAVREGGLGRAGEVLTLAQGLRQPNGVALRDGDLYVAAVDKVYNLPKIEDNLDAPPAPVLITDQLPGDSHHGWRYAAFGPDGLLYIAVGAPCNVCEAPDPFSSIIRMDDQGGYEVFARGIRNSVGLDWRPGSGVLWFTNNDRDWMGDDEPRTACTGPPGRGWISASLLPRRGARPGAEPGSGLRPLRPGRSQAARPRGRSGHALLHRRDVPAGLSGAVFIAEHGSWNRSKPIGYRVSLVRLEGDKAVDYQPFATGWLGGQRLGPPGGRAGGPHRRPVGQRRPGRGNLPHYLRETLGGLAQAQLLHAPPQGGAAHAQQLGRLLAAAAALLQGLQDGPALVVPGALRRLRRGLAASRRRARSCQNSLSAGR